MFRPWASSARALTSTSKADSIRSLPILEASFMPYHLSVLRKAIAYGWFALAAGAIYVGYTFYARYDANQKMQRQAVEKEGEEAGKNLAASRQYLAENRAARMPLHHSLKEGATGKLCYGVVNAKTVALDPPVERVWPALTRCIEIKPAHSTTYTLTATDEAGHSVQRSATVEVH